VSCREIHFNAAFPYEEARQRRRWFLPRCLPLPSTLPVGDKPPNTWGLHEVHGNVWEFTASPWTESHHNARRDGGIDPGEGDPVRIVVKGGSWFDAAIYARSASRRPRLRDEMDVNLGLRLVRELGG
jgi:formylglycine-generating enzyme required for sulfatase activity